MLRLEEICIKIIGNIRKNDFIILLNILGKDDSIIQ